MLTVYSTAGTIPDEALVTLTSKKYFGEQPEVKDELESDDEELDATALKNGEFEG
jgi:hypothetical protein